MEESITTYVSGVRTAPVQYENRMDFKKAKEIKYVYQPVRQGNRKYTISPIYSKPLNIKESELEEGPSLILRKKG